MIEAPPNKRAAVAKRGAEREKRDLFAARAEDEGSIKETMLPPPSSFTGSSVGARNENSVLFRVDQLARTAPLPVATAPAADARSDDEGVIDLKALSTAPPRPMGMPVAPLFSEPPPVTMEVATGPTKPARSWVTIAGIAAAAVVFLGVAGAGIAFAFRGEEPVKRTAAVVVAPPPAPIPPPAASPAPAAPEPPPAVAEEPPTKGKKGKKGKRGVAASGPITNKSAPPAEKKIKPADPCGCHGDFNCILACTAKGGK